MTTFARMSQVRREIKADTYETPAKLAVSRALAKADARTEPPRARVGTEAPDPPPLVAVPHAKWGDDRSWAWIIGAGVCVAALAWGIIKVAVEIMS